MENLNDCLSVNCNWANASNILWCAPRLASNESAAPGEVSTAHFLRRVAARAASTRDPRDLAAAAAAARALENRDDDAATAVLKEVQAKAAALACATFDPEAVVAEPSNHESSDSESGEDFLGRVGADLFADDTTPRRRPTRRGWTPGFRELVDLRLTRFDCDIGGRRVSCKLGYRENGTGSSVWDGAVVLACVEINQCVGCTR